MFSCANDLEKERFRLTCGSAKFLMIVVQHFGFEPVVMTEGPNDCNMRDFFKLQTPWTLKNILKVLTVADFPGLQGTACCTGYLLTL